MTDIEPATLATFARHPSSQPPVHEFQLDVPGRYLSGLLAEPAQPDGTKAVIVAIHGAGMHAGYFDTRTAPGLSLLELGAELGFTVWAPDRPGIGASAHLPEASIRLFPQADILLDAIDEFARLRPTGTGFLLVGHSYGLKVAWAMAARPRGRALLGVDGAASGARYNFDWSTSDNDIPPRRVAQRGGMWGPAGLYPKSTFRRTSLPLYPMPGAQAKESARWPGDIRSIGDQIRVPLRITYGEHEELWPITDPDLTDLRAVFPNTPRLSIEIEPFGAHNLSLGWAARSYHLKVVAFAEACCLSNRLDGMGSGL